MVEEEEEEEEEEGVVVDPSALPRSIPSWLAELEPAPPMLEEGHQLSW